MRRHGESGFTIVELMIAVTVFSLMLMVMLAGFLHIGRMFYKGINMARTQEVTRAIVDDVKADIRTNKGKIDFHPQGGGSAGYYCIGAHRYTYALGKQIGDTGTLYGLRRDTMLNFDSCAPPGSPVIDTSVIKPDEAKEYLANGMRVNRFDVGTCDVSGNCSCPSGLCDIKIHVVFNAIGTENDDLLTPTATDQNAQCTGALVGSQFCAVSDLSTVVGNELTHGAD